MIAPNTTMAAPPTEVNSTITRRNRMIEVSASAMKPIAAPAQCSSAEDELNAVHTLAPMNAPVRPPNIATAIFSSGVATMAHSEPSETATMFDLPKCSLSASPMARPQPNARMTTTQRCQR